MVVYLTNIDHQGGPGQGPVISRNIVQLYHSDGVNVSDHDNKKAGGLPPLLLTILCLNYFK